MDVAVDLYLAVLLLFTVLAFVLASISRRLWGAEGEWPQEPAAAEVAQKSSPGDQEAAGAGPEARKEVAAEQREKAAEDQSPTAEPSSSGAESIPHQLLAEPHKPELQEDAESKIPPLGASIGSSLWHLGQVEDAGDHIAFPSKAEEEDVDSGKEKLVVRELASTAATPAPVTRRIVANGPAVASLVIKKGKGSHDLPASNIPPKANQDTVNPSCP
ncbi:uncharacterized protein LOC136007984 [Lathamus discolor]|uniref:uncharacterized protein LOC136007984 n=1 Tax=Lathamus discolor TaxID=678569 RepID=UPI0032B72966